MTPDFRAATAFSAVLACSSHAAHAASELPAVSGVSTFGALFQGLLGLAIVLAALAGFFWFLRRFSPGQAWAQGVVIIGGEERAGWKSNDYIANILFISKNTVRPHIKSIYAKLDTHSRLQLALYAINSALF